MSLYAELKRRNVLRVGAAYVVVAWLLIQVAETIFPLFGFDETPARIVVIVLAIGFVPTLILAWVFELTPEGLKKEADVDRSESITPRTGRKLDRVIMVVLALGLAYFAFDKFVLHPHREAELVQQKAAEVEKARQEGRTEALVESYGDKSIAVLAFDDMSPKGDQEYLSDGIAEELLNLLAKIPELRVISRSSAFSYKGKDIRLAQVAEELDVAHILEGSVRKAGNRIRITAQLIEARSDTHLWSETYERELEDVFAIQDEISAAIVAALRDTIDLKVDDAPRATAAVSTEAHDAYLRGQYLLAQRELSGAVSEFEQAISLEPGYAAAHAQLAIACWLIGLDDRVPEHAAKAMALDPSIAEAHAAAGLVSWAENDHQGALRHFEKAIQINPSYVDVHTWMALILEVALGRYAEAFALRETAVRLDPLSLPARINYADGLIRRGRLSEADRETEKLASMAPKYHAWLRGLRSSQGGHWADGALALLDALLVGPDRPRPRYVLANLFAFMGLETEGLAIWEEPDPDLLRLLGDPGRALSVAQAGLAEDPGSGAGHAEVGLALASGGDYARARPHLEQSWQQYGTVDIGVSFDADHAAALIAARRAAGEDENVADLLAGIRDNVRRYREAGLVTFVPGQSPDYEDGLSRFLSGDEKEGLALIARAVEDGYFIPPGEAYLQVLYEHPDFAPVRGMQEARQVRERARFVAVVCSDNPYAAVWQPAEGTCDRRVAGDGN